MTEEQVARYAAELTAVVRRLERLRRRRIALRTALKPSKLAKAIQALLEYPKTVAELHEHLVSKGIKVSRSKDRDTQRMCIRTALYRHPLLFVQQRDGLWELR